MFENIGWIVEGKIKSGQREAFESVMNDLVEATRKENGTLNYQYYVSDDGDVLVYERFQDVASVHIHVSNWDNFATSRAMETTNAATEARDDPDGRP